jgi:Tfp pilus tip-associated adhesin PilY1
MSNLTKDIVLTALILIGITGFISGEFIIEEKADDEVKDAIIRRLIFLQNQNFIQTECRLIIKDSINNDNNISSSSNSNNNSNSNSNNNNNNVMTKSKLKRMKKKTIKASPTTASCDNHLLYSFDFTYIDDTIDACVHLMNKTGCHIVNIANEQEWRIAELAVLIKDLTKSSSEIIFLEAPKKRYDYEVERRVGSSDKLMKLVGHKPETNLEQGLKLIYEKNYSN